MKIADVAGTNAVVRCTLLDGNQIGIHHGELYPGSFIEMAPEVITELGLPIRYVNAVRHQPGGPPWWISAHQLHDQPPIIAENLLDELVDTEPEHEFFTQSRADWQAFTAFVLASTDSPASLGGTRGWGIGTATPNSIAVCLTNGDLLTAGTSEARHNLMGLAKLWHEIDEPDLTDLQPSFTPDNDDNGWMVRPQLRSHR